MTTLDLRGSGSTLRLAPNGGSATIRSFVVVGRDGTNGTNGAPGPTGAPGAPGATGPAGPPLPADQMAALSALYARQTGGVVAVTGPTLPTGLASGTKYVWNQTDPTTGELLDILTGTV